MKKKRKHIFKKISNFIAYLFLLFFIILIRLIPYKIAIYIGRFWGAFNFHIVRTRRKVVMKNLDIAFGDSKSKEEKMKIAKNCYLNFATTVVEMMKMPTMKKEFIQQLVESDDLDKIEQLRGEDKKNNFIALTAHLDNWELLGAYFATKNYPLFVIAKPMHNPLVDNLLNNIRINLGYEVLSSRGSLKEYVRRLKEGKILCFLADQDARRSGIFVDFFGTPASTFEGPAIFMNMLKLPILNLFIVRQNIFKHKIIVKDIFCFPENEEKEKLINEITRKHTKNLEEIIKEYPDQYFWFHKRWKTQKDKTTNLYE